MPQTSRLGECMVRLLCLNEQYATPRVRWLITLGVWIGSIAALMWAADRAVGLNSPPPVFGDEASYDALGWELAAGRGFALNLADPEFLKPYADLEPAAAGQLATAPGRGPIASRPPLLPLVMAGLNRMFGRQFRAVRLVNVAAMATVAALVAWTVCRLAGPLPALLGVFQFLVVDPRVRVASREILTEALACLLVAVLTLTLRQLFVRPRLTTALIAGAVVGLAVLLRTMFVLWLPVLLVMLWMTPRYVRRAASGGAARQEPRPPDAELRANSPTAGGVTLVAAFLMAAMVVFAPWGVRNCRVLGRFMPLGTQGTIELPSGYSDEAFARGGMWHNLDESGCFRSVDIETNTQLQREVARADYSSRLATAWCRAHPVQTALLPFMKVFQEFRPHMSADLYVLAFALLGLAVVRGTPEGRAGGTILLAIAFSVGLTWSVAGRFVFPALYVLHCAAAIGVWTSVMACTLGRRDVAAYNLFTASDL
ncbi:MAG: glycosyltransferase family 39 protein [Planctomycetaceae bacterium]